jgi:hypothetical protein
MDGTFLIVSHSHNILPSALCNSLFIFKIVERKGRLHVHLLQILSLTHRAQLSMWRTTLLPPSQDSRSHLFTWSHATKIKNTSLLLVEIMNNTLYRDINYILIILSHPSISYWQCMRRCFFRCLNCILNSSL